MVRSVITRPDDFFCRQIKDPSVLPATFVVVLAGLATVLSTVLISPIITGLLEGTGRELALMILLIYSFVAGVGIIVLWFIYAGLFYTISLYFDGSGKFRDVFVLTGWGFLPVILTGIVGSIAVYYVFRTATLPEDPQQLSVFMERVRDTWPLLSSSVFRQVMLLWQGLLWTLAVKHARDLTTSEATLTVAGPVLVTLLWNALQLL